MTSLEQSWICLWWPDCVLSLAAVATRSRVFLEVVEDWRRHFPLSGRGIPVPGDTTKHFGGCSRQILGELVFSSVGLFLSILPGQHVPKSEQIDCFLSIPVADEMRRFSLLEQDSTYVVVILMNLFIYVQHFSWCKIIYLMSAFTKSDVLVYFQCSPWNSEADAVQLQLRKKRQVDDTFLMNTKAHSGTDGPADRPMSRSFFPKFNHRMS